MENQELLTRLRELAKEANYTIDWVSPEWEPITKVKEDDRNVFMFILGRCLSAIAEQTPELGVTIVKWTGCAPEREFLCGADDDIRRYCNKDGP